MSNDGAITVVSNQNATVTDGNSSVIVAGNGNDVLVAGTSSVVTAGNGNDKVTVGAGSVVVIGNGNDTVTAGADSVVVAGNGNDTVSVGSGSVAVVGSGNDSITLGAGSTLVAGSGNDTIYLAASDNVVVGTGKDTFVVQATSPVKLSAPASTSVNEDGSIALAITAGTAGYGFGSELIAGFLASNDKIQFSTSQFANFAAVMAAAKQVGNDTIITGDAADTIDLVGVRLSSLTANNFQFVSPASVTVTISGIPAGVTLSDTAGALTVTNGSVTLTQAQLAGLTLHAGEVVKATLTVTATTSTGSSISNTVSLSVNPVAPTLSVPTSPLTVAAGGTVALGISETPFDSRDTVSVTIAGVPTDATLSAGMKNSNGSWTLTPTQLSGLTLKAGQAATTTLVVTATNTQGQTASVTQNIQLKIGTASTLSVTFTGVSFTDTGTQGDGITNNGSVTLSGTFTDSLNVSTVQVRNGTQVLGNATVDNTAHTWTFTPSPGLAQGNYNNLNVIATDSANNTANASTTKTFQIDTTPPTVAFTSVAGSSTPGSNVTNNSTVMFSGTVSDNISVSAVVISNNGVALGSATVNSNGTWTLTKTLPDGNYNHLTVTATDEANNTSSPVSTTLSVLVDTTPPAVTFGSVAFTNTGAPGAGVTNTGSVTFSGTVTDGVSVSSVVVSNGSTVVGNATVNGDGTWTLTKTLADGSYNHLSVTATDEAGNTASAPTAQTVQVDTAPPSITFDSVSFTDTGTPGDNITSNGSVTFSGTLADNVSVSQVQVFNNGTLLTNAVVSNGTHTWTLTTTLPSGTYRNFSATATDEAGNVSPSATKTQSFQIASAPPVVTFDEVSFVDSGTQGDGITNIGSVFLSGSVTDSVAVRVDVFNGTTHLGQADVSNGIWQFSPNLPQGSYGQLNVVATDIAGNTAPASTTQSAQVDNTPPSITFDTVQFTDTGTPGDGITKSGHVTLSGTVADNILATKVEIFNNGVSLGLATVSNGAWTFSPQTALAQGNYNKLSVTATDEAGNTTSVSTSQGFQVDSTPPTVTFDTVLFTDSGVQNDGITNNGNVTLSGTVSDNVSVAQVQVFNNGTSLGFANVSNGQWTFSPAIALGQGNYNGLSVTATDEAGNTTSATTSQAFQVDATTPSVTFDTVSFAATGALGVTDNNTITLSGTTSDEISVNKVEVFEGSQSLGLATVDNAAHTWTLSTNLNDGTYNQLSATATDEAGNATSISTAQSVQIDTTAPTVTFQTVTATTAAANTDPSIISAGGQVITMAGTVADNVSVAQVQIFNNGVSLGYAAVNAGNWAFTPQLGAGNYNALSVTATDEAGNSSSASTNQAVNVTPVSASVIDGYIQGATVFADSNGDGVLDGNEAHGITDQFGHFTLGAGTTNGTLIMTGGFDSATGLAFTGVLTAPTGSTQVTPLTTLVQSVAATGVSVADASAAVASALGLDPGTNLTTLDTVAAAYAGNSQAFVAASSVLNTVTMVASAVAGTGTDFGTAANNAFSALASQIVTLSTNPPGQQTLDLTNSTVITDAVSSTATSSGANVSADQAASIATVVTNVNTATNAAGASSTDAATLLTNVTGTSIVAQGSASSQLNAATAPTADPNALSNVVSANSGTNLSSSVSTAASTVDPATIATAPPAFVGLTPTDSTPNNSQTVHYLLSFSDSVDATTVTASDFTLTGTLPATIANIAQVAGSNGAQYVITVNTGFGDGTVGLSFAGVTVKDLAGRALLDQTTHAGPSYTIDLGAIEQAALSLNVTGTLINAAAATAVQFSVAGLESADTGLVTFSDGSHQVKVIVRGTATNYVANLSTLTDGAITSQLQVNPDAAGNVFTPVSGNAVTLDRDVNQQNILSITASGPKINNGVGDLNAGSIVTLTVNTSQAVTVNGSPTLTLNDGATATYVGQQSPTALTFIYNVLPGDNIADLAVSSLNSNGATIADLAGNNINLSIAPGVNPASVLQIDTTPPSVVSITQTDPVSSNASVVHYKVSFSEAITGLIVPQFTLTTTGAVTGAGVASITPVAGSNGTQFTVAVNTGTGSGTIALNFAGASVTDLAGNSLPPNPVSGAAYTVAPPPPMLWGSSIVGSGTPGDHLYGPSVQSNNGQFNLFYGETATNFSVNGPDAITQNLQSFDAFFLPFRGGTQAVATYNMTTFPFSYNELLPITLVPGSPTARQFDEIGIYTTEDASGNASLDRITATNPVSVNGAAPTVSAPTVIEALPAGDTVKYVIPSFSNTGTTGLMSSYEVAWDQYNAQTQTYQVEFQSFNPDNSTASPVTQLVNQTGVASYANAEGWFFRSANGAVSTDALLSATHNSATNSDTVTFQGYNVDGTLTSENFVLTPDLSHYAPGATASIVQSTINPPTRTGSILPIIYAPNASGGGYSAAWDETVTDSNGTHNQVEFAMFKTNSTGVTGSLQKQVTFQIADGLPQQIRVGSFSYLGQSYEVLAYGDTTSSHIVEFDANGNQIASYSEATNQFFNQLEIFGDGRVGLSYDNVIDSSGTTQFTTNIIDLRTSGIPSFYTGITNVNNREFAGTQFNDNVVGVANNNNEYYFVGRSTTGQGPSDAFTGSTTNSWNTAIFADARSNYTISTVNGVTTITNVGDPAHAGTLTTTNVQELAFTPGVDPTPLNASSNVIADGTVVMLGHDAGNESFTIDGGATLELATAESGPITFAGPTGTLQLDNASSYSTIDALASTAGSFAITGQGNVATTSGDAIDFTSSGGAVGTPANLSVTTGGAISASNSAATAINVVQNGFGNITVDATHGVSGGDYGIQAVNNGDGNVSVETAGTVSAAVQYGILAKSVGAGSVSVVTDAGSVVNSGGSGIVVNNRDQALTASAHSTITVTSNGNINAGPTANLSGSASGGIVAGYNGNNVGLGSVANLNVNGTVLVNNNANISGAAGYGIDAFNYGNGNVTVNDAAGTSVSGGQYGIAAFEESGGAGDIAVNVAANASITGGSINAIQAFSIDNGNISVSTSTGDVLTSGSTAINANNWSTAASASTSVTVIANGTIHSGGNNSSSGSAPSGIVAGFFPGGTNQVSSAVAGNVFVTSNAHITADGGSGINAYNFGIGNVTVTTGATSQINAAAGNGITANANGGGNLSVTNAGSTTGTTGMFAGVNGAGAISVENDGMITGTVNSGVNLSQNAAASTGSTTFTNTGTVTGAANRSAININNNAGVATINNTGTIASVTSQGFPAINESTANAGTVVINNSGKIYGTVNTSGTGAVGANTTVNNNAGGLWQSSYVDDEGTIVASGAGSTIAIIGTSGGIDVANNGTGSLTLSAGAAYTGDFLNIGQFAGSHGTVNVTGAGTTVNTTSGQFQNIQLGKDGTASLTVANHAVVTTTNMDVAVNYDAGVTDTLDINNGTLNAVQGLTIGDSGTASATVEGGGALNVAFLQIGNQATATGTLTVTGAGSVVSATNMALAANGGSATLNISNAGAVDVGAGTATIAGALHVGSSSVVGARGIINGNVVDDGNITVTSGTLEINGNLSGTGTTVINSGNTLKLDGSVSDSIFFAGGTGTLDVVNSSGFNGVIQGQLAAGDVLDFADISAAQAHIVGYTGNNSPGTLTVTDGAHTANIQLSGNYSLADFALGADTNGGTDITATPTIPPATIADGQTLHVSGSTGETVTFLGGADTLELDAPASTGTVNGVSSASGTFLIDGSGNVTTSVGDAIDFTSSGGAVGTPANVGFETAGAISATSNTATGINVVENGFGTISLDNFNTVTGGDYGIQAINNGNGDINMETSGSVTGTVQYGVLAKSIGTGSIGVVVDPASVITSGSSGIVVNNRDENLPASATSTITVTNHGTINAGATANLSGSVSGGIVAGYNGNNHSLASIANTNVNGTVVVNNDGTINNGAGYGINAFTYGNGDVTVNDSAGTSVSGTQYGISAGQNSKGTGNVAVNVGANATINGGSLYGVLAFNNADGSTDISTSSGDTITSGSTGLNAANQSTVVSAGHDVTVIANGTIHAGANPNTSGSASAGILAGYNPAGTNQNAQPNSTVAGSVFVTSNAIVTAAGANGGLNAYTYGTGNVTVTTGATSSITATAGTGINANANDGGNVSVTNGGSSIGTTGLFAGDFLGGTIFVENDGTVTSTVNSGIGISHNTLSSTGSTTVTNTGTVVGAVNRSGINITNNAGIATINNSGTIGNAASIATAPSISENGAGILVINNTGTLDGSIVSNNVGEVGANTTVNNNAGGLWQTSYITDSGTINATGSTINVTGTSSGIVVGNNGGGAFTASAGSTVTADFLNIAQGVGSQGTVTITGPGTTLNTTAGQYQNIAVGFDGTASLTVSNQAVVTTTNMGVGGNHEAGITGALDVNNATLNTQGLTIGDAGTANATVEAGGTVSTGFLFIGNQATGVGSLTVTGAGSVVSTNGLGFGNFGASATLNITNGGAFDLGAGASTIAGALHIGSSGSLGGSGTINGNVVDDGNITVASGTLDIAGNLSGTGTVTINPGATLELGGSAAETIAFIGGGTLQLDNAPGFSGTINGLASGSGNFAITGQGSVATTSGDAIDFTSSGGAVGTPAELSVTTGGPISATSSTAAGINVTQNGFGDITIDTLNTVSGGNFGIEATNSSDGNISIETANTVTGTVQYGVLARTTGAGNVNVTTDVASVISSGGSGIVVNNRDLNLAASSNSMVTVTNNGTISAGPTNNLSGSASGGIVAGYNGASGTASAANTAVNGTVIVNNNSTINNGAGYGVNAYNYGNGDVTVNDAAGTSVSGTQYGLSAAQNSKGTGNVAVNVGANAIINAGSLYGVLATSVSDGSVSISTSSGDVITSGGTGLNASEQASAVSVGHNVTVIANGTIHAGANLNTSGSGSAGILAGFNPNGTNTVGVPNNPVTGSVFVTSNAVVTAAGTNGGINAYNYGSGNVTVTTGATSSVTATAGTGINANANDGGNVSVTNGGSSAGTTGLFAGDYLGGTIVVENDGTVTGTSFSGIGVTHNTATSTGSTTITNTVTGTVIGAANHSAININNDAGIATINNSGVIGSVASLANAPAITENAAGTVIINNNGTIDGGIITNSTGFLGANGTVNNNAGGLWQANFIGDDGTVNGTGAGSSIQVLGSGGFSAGSSGSGTLTLSAGAALSASFLNIGNLVGSHGTVTVTGPGTSVNTTSGQYQNIGVGFDGTASLTIANQAAVTTSFMDVASNHDVGVTDTLDVNNATLNATQGLTIGDAGTANATVEGGGVVNTSFLSIGTQANGTGSLTVTGVGSVVSTVGIAFGPTGGSAALNVSNGGAVDIGSGTTTVAGAVHVGSSGFLQGAGTINGNVVNDGSLSVNAGQLEVTGALSGSGSTTIADGATLKLDSTVSQTISFAGSTGTLDIASSSGFNGTIGGQLAIGDVLDFSDMAGASARIVGYTGNSSPGTLTITDDNGHTANINLTGNYVLENFKLGTDNNGGTTLVDPPIGDASINNSVALLSNYMASSFPTAGTGQTATATSSTQENPAILATSHAA
jgi:T5SS/PEP-CTERM-associated repeat protein